MIKLLMGLLSFFGATKHPNPSKVIQKSVTTRAERPAWVKYTVHGQQGYSLFNPSFPFFKFINPTHKSAEERLAERQIIPQPRSFNPNLIKKEDIPNFECNYVHKVLRQKLINGELRTQPTYSKLPPIIPFISIEEWALSSYYNRPLICPDHPQDECDQRSPNYNDAAYKKCFRRITWNYLDKCQELEKKFYPPFTSTPIELPENSPSLKVYSKLSALRYLRKHPNNNSQKKNIEDIHRLSNDEDIKNYVIDTLRLMYNGEISNLKISITKHYQKELNQLSDK